MFPDAFLNEMLAKYPQATAADAQRISAWIAEKHPHKPFTNPHGMFEKLLKAAAAENGTAARYPIAAPQAKANPKPFAGYDATGACFRSPVPIGNPQSDFARWIVREVRDQLLTPADVVRIVRQRDQAVWQAVGVEVLRQRASHTHWTISEHGTIVPIERDCDVSCWASLPATSGLAESIRSWGGWYPWLSDRDAWLGILQREAARRGTAA